MGLVGCGNNTSQQILSYAPQEKKEISRLAQTLKNEGRQYYIPLDSAYVPKSYAFRGAKCYEKTIKLDSFDISVVFEEVDTIKDSTLQNIMSICIMQRGRQVAWFEDVGLNGFLIPTRYQITGKREDYLAERANTPRIQNTNTLTWSQNTRNAVHHQYMNLIRRLIQHIQ